jgi:hypothetical protein
MAKIRDFFCRWFSIPQTHISPPHVPKLSHEITANHSPWSAYTPLPPSPPYFPLGDESHRETREMPPFLYLNPEAGFLKRCGLYRSPLQMWGLLSGTGFFISYWCKTANSDRFYPTSLKVCSSEGSP